MLLKKYSIFIIISSLSIFINAQNQIKLSLESERNINLKKINEAEKILEETEQSKNVTIGKLKVINKQIKNRQNLIQNLRYDITKQNKEIGFIQDLIISLTNDLEILNKEYSDMIFYSYKSRSSLDKLGYIFSSENYNQMFRRLNYIFQYSDLRKKQIVEIDKVKATLSGQKENIVKVKEVKNRLLKDELRENNKLQKLKNRQKNVISSLNKKQKNIRKEIKNRRESLARLDELIRDIIRKEKEKSILVDDIDVNLLELTEGFESSVGKLDWPVNSGFISNKFGEHPHPIIRNIKIKNDGIDIQTKKSSKVYAIYSGKVSTVAFIPGMNNVIIINHGEYYTLYAKLKNLTVVKGDIISTGDIIADLVTNSDGITELQFQVWKNNIKLNPENWIMKK